MLLISKLELNSIANAKQKTCPLYNIEMSNYFFQSFGNDRQVNDNLQIGCGAEQSREKSN